MEMQAEWPGCAALDPNVGRNEALGVLYSTETGDSNQLAAILYAIKPANRC